MEGLVKFLGFVIVVIVFVFVVVVVGKFMMELLSSLSNLSIGGF